MRKTFGFIVIVLAVVAFSCQPQGRSSKVWLHRANDIAKAKHFQNQYAGLEVDVHFVDSIGTFIIKHDAGESSTVQLEDWFASLDQRSTLGFWIDFKNLDESNRDASAKEMARLREVYDLNGMIIVEASKASCLKAFDDMGFRTSYYIPDFVPEQISHEKLQELTDCIRNKIETYGLETISGYSFQYQFMKDSFPEMRKLIWYELYDANTRDAFIKLVDEDDNTDVILVAERY